MDLSSLRNRCLDVFHANQVPGMPFGCVRPHSDAMPDFYASADWALIRTICGEDLRQSLSDADRNEWIAYLASHANPQDGSFPVFTHHSKLHANGTAVGAFGALGGRMPVPVQLYRAFSDPASVGSWLETAIDWRMLWSASHLFWGGMHCFALSSAATPAWHEAVFAWLDAHVDPATGWWCLGIPHGDRNQPLGGAVHILPIYQHLGRRFPHPERLIDSVLAMQLPEGNWIKGSGPATRGFDYLDLDGLYALDAARQWAPGYRSSDIEAAATRHAALIESTVNNVLKCAFASHPHQLLAIIGTLGLAQRFAPERFQDDRMWTDIFSDPALYRVRECEAIAQIPAI